MNPTSGLQPDIDHFKQTYPSQIQSYEFNSRTMRYAWSGDPAKRPILFVHGSPGSWEGWSHFLVDPGLERQFQLIAVDRLGFGGSDPGHAETSLQVQAAAVMEVLKFNKSGLPAILVGHSFGGPVIARAGMDFPEKVGGLVFVASSVSPELEKTKWMQYPATWWPLRVLIPTELRVCNEEIMPLKGQLEAMLPLWQKIAAKVSIVQGEKDDLVPPGNVDFLQKHIDEKLIVKIVREPEMNHFVPWKHPELIVDGIETVDRAL